MKNDILDPTWTIRLDCAWEVVQARSLRPGGGRYFFTIAVTRGCMHGEARRALKNRG